MSSLKVKSVRNRGQANEFRPHNPKVPGSANSVRDLAPLLEKALIGAFFRLKTDEIRSKTWDPGVPGPNPGPATKW